MSDQVKQWPFRVVETADIAALLPQEAVQHTADALANQGAMMPRDHTRKLGSNFNMDVLQKRVGPQKYMARQTLRS